MCAHDNHPRAFSGAPCQRPALSVSLVVLAQTNRFAIRKNGPGKRAGADAAEAGTDYSSKLLHLAWHPEANVIAAAASNSLYMYCA